MPLENQVTWYTGPCDLVVCRADISHGHLTCPDCGSVTFRNAQCPTCVSAWGGRLPDVNQVPMQSADDIRLAFRSVTCPKCLAAPGEKCRDYRGGSQIEHRKRVSAVVMLRNDFGWGSNG